MDVRERRSRETKSPDRAKIYRQKNHGIVKPITRSVQVVYYLTRNGQLEHPHFMEVSLLASQPLTLRDVMKRLAALRGNAMPSMYSWSCKRGYKNGYVWNDLAENDQIYPSDGAEIVLKGSELVEGSSEIQMRKNRASLYSQEQNNSHILCSKPKRTEPEKTTPSYGDEDFEEEEDLCEIDEEKTSYTSSTTPHSRCSRGVSAGEIELSDDRKTAYTSQPESTLNHSNESTRNQSIESTRYVPNESTRTESNESTRNQSIESTRYVPNESTRTESNESTRYHQTASTRHDSSDSNRDRQTASTRCDSGESTRQGLNEPTDPRRFEDGEPVVSDTGTSRGSVLLQLISCGNMNMVNQKNGGRNLHRGVLCKNLIDNAVVVAEEEEEEDDREMIRFMSENPRFGNLQAEEKEYFSGSIVESVSQERVKAEPVIKKSNSYKEERNKKCCIEEDKEEEKRKEKTRNGKCIPRRRNTTSCFA